MPPTVAVLGGGYGGNRVASALDDVADVVLVDPKDAFVHNVAALRGLVDPQWTNALFYPYASLLNNGRHRRDRAVRVDGGKAADGGERTEITLGDGTVLRSDYTVLATGSGYPFPAKIDTDDSAEAAARIHATRAELARAGDVLLLGAGPVGLELAGEIRAAWPEKTVTLVDPASDVVSGPMADALPAEFRAEVRTQLDELKVRSLLGTTLNAEPPSEPGVGETCTVTTRSGETLTADIWFRCFGAAANTDYLAGSLARARTAGGRIAVDDRLRASGHDRIYAIGDLTELADAGMARAAESHARFVANDLRARITGSTAPFAYTPGEPGISLPLGPHGGVSYAPAPGVLGAAETARLKGTDLKTAVYRGLFGLD